MFTAIAALALASTSAQPPAQSTSPLTSTASWWERVTVSVTDDGKTQGCHYMTSLQPAVAQDCTASNSASASGGVGAKDQYTSITFERRFTPGSTPRLESLQPGERLLGGQVMALAIDARGAVKNCRVVATSGAVTPQYGCNEAQAERFQASASDSPRTPQREGYLSIIVYGHAEHVV